MRALVLLLAVGAQIPAHERTPTQIIAAVLLEFVHACTPAQRASLQAIVHDDDTSDSERILATAGCRSITDPIERT